MSRTGVGADAGGRPGRKQQEQEIRNLAAFPSESPMPILRINNRGVIIYANQPSRPLLEYWGVEFLQTLPLFWRNQVEEVLAEGVEVYGGFAGTETLLSERNPAANITILSGDIGTLGDPSDNCYHVVYNEDLGAGSRFFG